MLTNGVLNRQPLHKKPLQSQNVGTCLFSDGIWRNFVGRKSPIMKKEESFRLGSVAKAHALAGELVFAFTPSEDPEEYEDLAEIWLGQGDRLVAYEIESFRPQPNSRALVKLKGVDSIEAARQLAGAELWVPLEEMPELEEGDFYLHEVLGFRVVDEKSGELGQVADMYTSKAHPLLVMLYQGKEVLIPIVPEVLVEIVKSEKIIRVRLPEGLLDVYLGENPSHA